MSSELRDILANKKLPDEPREFAIIRTFMQEKFQETPQLQLLNNSIVVGVHGSALAATLRFELQELKDRLESDKDIIIRSV